MFPVTLMTRFPLHVHLFRPLVLLSFLRLCYEVPPGPASTIVGPDPPTPKRPPSSPGWTRSDVVTHVSWSVTYTPTLPTVTSTDDPPIRSLDSRPGPLLVESVVHLQTLDTPSGLYHVPPSSPGPWFGVLWKYKFLTFALGYPPQCLHPSSVLDSLRCSGKSETLEVTECRRREKGSDLRGTPVPTQVVQETIQGS